MQIKIDVIGVQPPGSIVRFKGVDVVDPGIPGVLPLFRCEMIIPSSSPMRAHTLRTFYTDGDTILTVTSKYQDFNDRRWGGWVAFARWPDYLTEEMWNEVSDLIKKIG